MPKSPYQQAFEAGYVCAVANILNLHGEEVIARDVLRGNTPDDWRHINREDIETLVEHGLIEKPKRKSNGR